MSAYQFVYIMTGVFDRFVWIWHTSTYLKGRTQLLLRIADIVIHLLFAILLLTLYRYREFIARKDPGTYLFFFKKIFSIEIVLRIV